MKMKKIWILMAMVFLMSGGLVFGEVEMSEAAYECIPTFNGFTGGTHTDGHSGTEVCTEETHSADWWCTDIGSQNDCSDNDTDTDYNFCSGSSKYNVVCDDVAHHNCSDDTGGCSAGTVTKTDCPANCENGLEYAGTCVPFYSGNPIAGCVRGAGATCSHSSTGVCNTNCCKASDGKECVGGVCQDVVVPPVCTPKTATDCGANECGIYPDGCDTGGTYDCGVCAVGECTGSPGVCVSTSCCSLTGSLSCLFCQEPAGDSHHGIGMYTRTGKVYCAGFLDTSETTGTICLYEDGVARVDTVGEDFGYGPGESDCSNVKRNIGEGEEHDYECRLYSGSTCGAGSLLCSTSPASYKGPPAPPATHKDCVGLSCVDVAGAGADLCTVVPNSCVVACVSTEDPELTCDDGIDNDCDGFFDCDDLDCVGNPVCDGGGEGGEEGGDPVVAPCGLGTGELCNPLADRTTGAGWASVTDIAQGMLNYLLGLVGSIALLFLIIAGVMYMTAGGSEEKITTAKKILTGAIIGLAIVLLAYSLLAEVNKILSP